MLMPSTVQWSPLPALGLRDTETGRPSTFYTESVDFLASILLSKASDRGHFIVKLVQ